MGHAFRYQAVQNVYLWTALVMDRLLERKNALVARKEELLNISAQRQGKEESWDRQTEELAKVWPECFQF